MSTSVHHAPPPVPTEPHILDNAAWAALTGPHAGLAERVGRAARYPTDISPFSAVCTHPDHRGHGLATRLVRAVAAGIRERGDTPFLHAAASNTSAIRLYESIGFTVRRRTRFLLVRAPDGQPEARGPGERGAGQPEVRGPQEQEAAQPEETA